MINGLLHWVDDLAREHSPTHGYKLTIDYDSMAAKCSVAITFPCLIEGIFLESKAEGSSLYLALYDAVALLIGKIEMRKVVML